MKKAVLAGIAGVAAIAGAVVYHQNPEILSQLTGSQQPSQTSQVADVEAHNARIQNTARENMVIECSNQLEFYNSFTEMKKKLPEADQEKLNQAMNEVIKRKNLSEQDINENLCPVFKGWSEAKFLEEASKK